MGNERGAIEGAVMVGFDKGASDGLERVGSTIVGSTKVGSDGFSKVGRSLLLEVGGEVKEPGFDTGGRPVSTM